MGGAHRVGVGRKPTRGRPASGYEQVALKKAGLSAAGAGVRALWLAGVIAAIAIMVFVIFMAERNSYHLATEGASATARVVHTDYGTRDENFGVVFVTGPIGQDAPIYQFDRHPAVGDLVRIRYYTGDPGVAIEADQSPWDAFPAVLASVVVAGLLVFGAALVSRLIRLTRGGHGGSPR